ncbi:DinB family protein [Tenacibaculum sp. M341]|uniref:DinB family protein n=1 Tax=Tenacibaculum sp. M341 TaxID=2530339 RepID=UPI00104C3A74|nr:DinB family protein [Tenacibaculum sp. M341]TCI91346.1 DinB family protein [Tenacibaculum sp. M341]
MELSSEQLLQDLSALTTQNSKAIALLKEQPTAILNWKENAESWSILECIEHLNRYGDFYIPEITKRIQSAKHKKSKIFKSNWLGRYFSKAVGYREDLNKMKTFKVMNPLNSNLSADTLEKFLHHQNQIIALLNQAKKVNLDKTKTAISISKIIKLKLGDTFRVLIYHNERHVKQAERVLNSAKGVM